MVYSVQPVITKVTTVAETSATGSKVATQVKPPQRQHKQVDEVDLTIFKSHGKRKWKIIKS